MAEGRLKRTNRRSLQMPRLQREALSRGSIHGTRGLSNIATRALDCFGSYTVKDNFFTPRTPMNDFNIVSIRALEGRLPADADADAAYYASDAFRQRSDLVRQEDTTDKLAVLHYLLERIALDPRELQRMRKSLCTGLVNLHFFGWVNPVNLFYLSPNTPEHAQLTQAIERNVASNKFRAAKHALRWRSLEKSFARQRHEDARDKAFLAKHPWATAEERKQDPAAAKARDAERLKLADVELRRIREMRNTRLARISAMAAPGLHSYHDLLQDIALNVLTPPREVATA